MLKSFTLIISIFFILLSYSSTLLSASSDSNLGLEGRWQGITLCKWNIDEWGGGEYELGNGKFTATLDFTIITEDGKKKLKSKRFINFGDRTSKIHSYKIKKKTFTLTALAFFYF